MSKGHNKKRNVGLIFEQVLVKSAEALMENNKNKADLYLAFLKKYYKNNTEISKEFKLFRALLKTADLSEAVSERILSLAKESIKKISVNNLKKEKDTLVNEANRVFGKDVLFSTRIEKYRGYATVQSLFNEWRHPGTLPIEDVAVYEERLKMFMQAPESLENNLIKNKKVKFITTSIFKETFEKKYSGALSNTQKSFLSFILAASEEEINAEISSTRRKALHLLKEFNDTNKNEILKSKYKSVYKKIQSIELGNKNAKSQQMIMLKLIDELEEEDE